MGFVICTSRGLVSSKSNPGPPGRFLKRSGRKIHFTGSAVTQREARLHLHRARGEVAFVHMGTLRRPPSRHPHRPKAAWISLTQGLERELGHSPRAAALHFFTPCWFQGHEAAQAGANRALSPTSPDIQHTSNAHVGTGKARCVWSFSCLVLAITSVTHSRPRHANALKLYLQCLCQHRV